MIIDKILFRSLLDKDEKILMVAHVHPFIVYAQLLKAMFFGMLIPAGGYYLFPPLWAIWLAWAVIGALLFAYRFLQWYLDAWIVTNLSVIDYEWESPFSQSTNRIEYGNIDGITNETKGFWGTVFRFGNIQITHVSGSPLILESVASPRKVERFIMEHQQKFVQNQSFDDHAKLKDLLTKLLRSSAK
ncbi:MAG: hypothetical protein WC777_05735 [Candidatus Gracilibacteria bacterium]|jgi:hypothetical protein